MVKYPSIRKELLEFVGGLADIDYQHQAWVNKIFPSGIEYDSFDEAVHFFYDDTQLAENPEREIGVVLESLDEVTAIRNLINSLDVVLETMGKSATDEEYIESPAWEEVVQTAKIALSVLKRSGESRVSF